MNALFTKCQSSSRTCQNVQAMVGKVDLLDGEINTSKLYRINGQGDLSQYVPMNGAMEGYQRGSCPHVLSI